MESTDENYVAISERLVVDSSRDRICIYKSTPGRISFEHFQMCRAFFWSGSWHSLLHDMVYFQLMRKLSCILLSSIYISRIWRTSLWIYLKCTEFRFCEEVDFVKWPVVIYSSEHIMKRNTLRPVHTMRFVSYGSSILFCWNQRDNLQISEEELPVFPIRQRNIIQKAGISPNFEGLRS